MNNTNASIRLMSQSPRVGFSGFWFDPATGELTGPAGTVRLQPQPAQVLAMLVARPGELIARKEFKAALWPETVVETDQGLNYCIRHVRAALGDDAERGRFIETLPRRGYRFVAPLDPPEARDRPMPAGRFGRWPAVAVATIMVAVVLIRPHRALQPKVALLPMASERPTPDWAVAVNRRATGQILLDLQELEGRGVGVVGPATTARLATDPRPHPALGRELGVDYVMSGGIRLNDSTLFVQLVRVSDGVHVYVFRGRAFAVNTDSLVAAAVQGAAARMPAG